MSRRRLPICCHDLKSPSHSKPARSAVRIEARFQGSTWSWSRGICSSSSAQVATAARACAATPCPRAERDYPVAERYSAFVEVFQPQADASQRCHRAAGQSPSGIRFGRSLVATGVRRTVLRSRAKGRRHRGDQWNQVVGRGCPDKFEVWRRQRPRAKFQVFGGCQTRHLQRVVHVQLLQHRHRISARCHHRQAHFAVQQDTSPRQFDRLQ